jgi:serine/threonine-protein kinase RsbW
LAASSWNWTCEYRIPSDTQATSTAVAPLLAHLETAGWSSRDIFGIHMAVEEALVNAIQHGNGEDPAKSVHVVYRTTPTRVRIEITDEGTGFRPAAVADPTTADHLAEPHGRGLLLMRAYMTKVEYYGCGNKLAMEKRRTRRGSAA